MNRLPLRVDHLVGVLTPVLAKHALLFAGLALWIVRGSAKRGVLWWYAVLACAAALLAAKVGAEENYLLEAIAAACACAASLLAAMPRPQRALGVACLAAQLALLLPARPVPVFTRTYAQEIPAGTTALAPTEDDAKVGGLVLGEVKSATAPVLCEDLGYLLLAGKEVVLDPYQHAQLARIGKWNDARIVAMLEEGRFALVVLKSDPATLRSDYFTPAMLRAMQGRYVVQRQIGAFYVLAPSP